MKRVFTHEQPAMAGYVQALLEGHGIRCAVRGQFLAGAVGELPPNECWPEVWVADDQADWALEVIARVCADARPGPGWVCPQCAESIEGQFAVCWNCGGLAPAGEALA